MDMQHRQRQSARLAGSFQEGTQSYSVATLLHAGARYADAIASLPPRTAMLLLGGGDGDRIPLIVRLLGCLLARARPVLDEKHALAGATRKEEGTALQLMKAPDLAEPLNTAFPSDALDHLARLDALGQDETPALSFATSGSTGDAKLVAKHWRALASEACALAELYGIKPGKRIVTLVSPLHIYGFLHTVMLALATGAQAHFVTTPHHLLTDSCGITGRIDLLVTVPPLWPLVKRLAGRCNIGVLTTSGAGFGAMRTADLLASGLPIERALEIFGSTETGGIGVRELTRGAEAPFTLFEGITLTPADEPQDRFTLHSPFLYPGSSCILDDALRLEGERCFYHLGRTDSIFKYAGKRYALAEIERELAALLGHDNVCCIFRERDNHSKGGVLIAVIEGGFAPRNENTLRRDYLGRAATPPPERFLAVDKLPRDTNGKIARAALWALLEDSPGESQNP